MTQADATQRESYFRDIVVEKDATLSGAVCILCSVTVRGTVQGEVVVVWGDITVEGRIAAGAVVAGGSVFVRENGVVETEAVAAGGHVVQSGHGTVKGEVSEAPYIYLPGQPRLVFPGTLIFVGCNVLLSMLYLAVGRPRVAVLADSLGGKRVILSLVVGAIVMAAMIWLFDWASDLQKYDDEVSLALCIAWVVLTLPGLAGLSLAIGRRLRQSAGIAAAMFVGALLLSLLAMVPLLGLAVFGVVWVLALGVTFMGRFGFARSAAPAIVNP